MPETSRPPLRVRRGERAGYPFEIHYEGNPRKWFALTAPEAVELRDGLIALLAERQRARAQLEVLQWLDENGVDAEQLDMALEKFVEPYGLTHLWEARHAGD